MKTHHNNQKKNKSLIISLSIIGVLVLFAIGYIVINRPFVPSTDDTPTDSQQTDDTPTDPDPNDQDNTDQDEPTPGQPPQDDTPVQSSTATINVPSYQASGDTISVNVAISEAWSSTATCTMTLSGAAQRTVHENVFAQAQISGCLLETSGLPSGNYTVSIYAENSGERTNTHVIRVTL